MNTVSIAAPNTNRRRWMGLIVVCLAQLMIVLDTTIVNVALPAIQRDLHFSQGNLTWVVNAFLIAFGSFLLLAGRLGDLFGRRRVFLAGVAGLGSTLVTLSLMTAVYAIVEATSHGWTSTYVLGFGAVAAALMAAFLRVEARIANPIMPLRILRLRGLVGSSVVRGFRVTAMYSTFFLGTLYLEHVRHYSALHAGLSFMPWTVTVGILSLGVTA